MARGTEIRCIGFLWCLAAGMLLDISAKNIVAINLAVVGVLLMVEAHDIAQWFSTRKEPR